MNSDKAYTEIESWHQAVRSVYGTDYKAKIQPFIEKIMEAAEADKVKPFEAFTNLLMQGCASKLEAEMMLSAAMFEIIITEL